MSMAKCKCGVIFDTDIHLETDESGNCCCDNCFEEIMVSFEEDIEDAIKRSTDEVVDINVANMVEILTNKGYRKVN